MMKNKKRTLLSNDFAIRKIFSTIMPKIKDKFDGKIDEEINVEHLKAFVEIFLEGFFDAIKENKDVRIPKMGTFYVHGPQYAAHMAIKKAMSNGEANGDVLHEIASVAAKAEAKRIIEYNYRPMKHNRSSSKFYPPKVHSIRSNMIKQNNDYKTGRGNKVVKVKNKSFSEFLNKVKNKK